MGREKTYENDDRGTYYVVSARSRVQQLGRHAGGKWTIDDLWCEYQRANPGLKGMSVYLAIYNAHLREPFGSMEPAAISHFDLDRLKLESMRGKSPKTVANTLELLRRIVNFGVNRRLCEGPGIVIRLPQVNNLKTEDLAQEELGRLVAVLDRHLGHEPGSKEDVGSGLMKPSSTSAGAAPTATSPYFAGAAMMKLVLLTGVRRGELFRLKWDDLDFFRGNIRLREPKSGRDAVIPMSTYAGALLDVLPRATGSDYVFPGKDGGQRRCARKQVNAIKAEAGLPPDFRPLHGLRHVFASGLISHAVEFQIVRRLLTHAGGTVTHRYAHIRDDALRAAAELAGRLVEEASTDG